MIKNIFFATNNLAIKHMHFIAIPFLRFFLMTNWPFSRGILLKNAHKIVFCFSTKITIIIIIF